MKTPTTLPPRNPRLDTIRTLLAYNGGKWPHEAFIPWVPRRSRTARARFPRPLNPTQRVFIHVTPDGRRFAVVSTDAESAAHKLENAETQRTGCTTK